jgi:hypothetical protein
LTAAAAAAMWRWREGGTEHPALLLLLLHGRWLLCRYAGQRERKDFQQQPCTNRVIKQLQSNVWEIHANYVSGFVCSTFPPFLNTHEAAASAVRMFFEM